MSDKENFFDEEELTETADLQTTKREPSDPQESDTAEEILTDSAAAENARLMEEIDSLKRRLTAAEEDRARRERELKCLGILEAAGLPLGLAEVVQSARDMEGAAELIRKTVRTLTEEEISRRCRSDAPPVGSPAGLSRDDIIRMPVAELQRIFKGK